MIENPIIAEYKKFSALTIDECNFLYETACNIPNGKVVVAGTYLGGDSAMIINSCPNPVLILDSFEGLSEPVPEKDGPIVKAGECAIPHYLSFLTTLEMFECRNNDISIHKMWITLKNLNEKIADEEIALLWLDLDLYQPTLDCMIKFLPWLGTNGICLVHDYDFNRLPGVKAACDELKLDFERGAGGIWRMKE